MAGGGLFLHFSSVYEDKVGGERYQLAYIGGKAQVDTGANKLGHQMAA
ncbi:protein of unknown function [Vibrio tapetis subsp. tapetis]|uniref:Uncharacterized protein n=1 Tax=Vibrio tapetis subsp. tapetis TaxID=1671868 RepID=A0A2N8ZJP8_9VIBR|nr:protein of unknown function [Vibrio tapetis subsp. tapetis]